MKKMYVRAKSLKVGFAVVVCGALFSLVSACGDVTNDPTTTGGSTSPTTVTSAEEFIVAPGVFRTVTKTLPHTVTYEITVPADDNAPFDSLLKAPILLGYGPSGIAVAPREFGEIRTYKIKNYDLGGRVPCGEPRYPQEWVAGQTYKVEVTWSTDSVSLTIDGSKKLDVCGTVSSERTFRVGWPQAGYAQPGLTGAKIKLLEGWK